MKYLSLFTLLILANCAQAMEQVEQSTQNVHNESKKRKVVPEDLSIPKELLTASEENLRWQAAMTWLNPREDKKRELLYKVIDLRFPHKPKDVLQQPVSDEMQITQSGLATELPIDQSIQTTHLETSNIAAPYGEAYTEFRIGYLVATEECDQDGEIVSPSQSYVNQLALKAQEQNNFL